MKEGERFLINFHSKIENLSIFFLKNSLFLLEILFYQVSRNDYPCDFIMENFVESEIRLKT